MHLYTCSCDMFSKIATVCKKQSRMNSMVRYCNTANQQIAYERCT